MVVRNCRVVVVGGGVAGVYVSQQLIREGIDDIILIEKSQIGGLIYYGNCLENVPGFLGAEGRDFANYLRYLLERYGVSVVRDEILKIEIVDGRFFLEGVNEVYLSDYVVVATGTKPKRLGIPGEIYHPDWIRWDGLDVVIIGGGDSALDYAIRIKRFGGNVTLLHRGKLRGLESLIRMCESLEVKFVAGSLEGYLMEEGKYKLKIGNSYIICDRVVCAIGREPNLPEICFDYGSVSFPSGKTYIKGLYIVGSVVLDRFRQCMLCGGMGIAAGMDISSEVRGK